MKIILDLESFDFLFLDIYKLQAIVLNRNYLAALLQLVLIPVKIDQTPWRKHRVLLLRAVIASEAPLDKICVRFHQYILA